jgi:hypothetical protein
MGLHVITLLLQNWLAFKVQTLMRDRKDYSNFLTIRSAKKTPRLIFLS